MPLGQEVGATSPFSDGTHSKSQDVTVNMSFEWLETENRVALRPLRAEDIVTGEVDFSLYDSESFGSGNLLNRVAEQPRLLHPHRVRTELIFERDGLSHPGGPQYEDESNYLRVFMAQIRRKLEPDPAHPRYFITEPGMGYRFENG